MITFTRNQKELSLARLQFEPPPTNTHLTSLAIGPGDQGSILGRVILRTQKWYLLRPCLTLIIIWYGSRAKWSNPGNGAAPSQHLGVVAIKK